MTPTENFVLFLVKNVPQDLERRRGVALQASGCVASVSIIFDKYKTKYHF